MKARQYTEFIDIWQDIETADGFGGYTNVPTFIKSVWSQLKTQGASFKFQQMGLNDFKTPVIFAIRGKNNLNITEDHFVKYRNKRYNIKSIENVDLQNLEINIYCDGTT